MWKLITSQKPGLGELTAVRTSQALMEQTLLEHGKSYEFFSYLATGHAFFCVDRTAYRPLAVADGWRRIFDFYERALLGLPSRVAMPTPAELAVTEANPEPLWVRATGNMREGSSL
jgi:hypothetical protein